jgi:hypothetical protein
MWDVSTGQQLLTVPTVPLGFSNDGQRLIGGSIKDVMFCEFSRAEPVSRLTGHLSPITHIHWSRDHRHFVSLDNRFEVRVWDVSLKRAIDSFRPPPGDYFAANAAVALSDDGQLLAYASGGTKPVALIRDIQARRTIAEWQLPLGFDKLRCVHGRKFQLVREERRNEGEKVLQTVIRQLEPGLRPATLVKVLRPADETDLSGFFTARLTPDGRFHLWLGPRAPCQKCRVEVREVETGRLLRRVSTPAKNGQDGNATLSSDGHIIAIVLDGLNFEDGPERSEWPWVRTKVADLSSEDSRWHVCSWNAHRVGTETGVYLRTELNGPDWLRLGDATNGDGTAMAFSFDSRRLALGDRQGSITVYTLEGLKQTVDDFESKLLRK